MRTLERSSIKPVIWLKTDRFVERCSAMQAGDVRARARILGVHRWTMQKLEDRQNPVSSGVVAQALLTFSDLKFEDLFEAETVAHQERAAA